MDIKLETQDGLPPSFYPDDRHFDKYNGNIPDQFKDEGRSTDRIKVPHFKEEHIDVDRNRDCKKNVLNVKTEKDDEEWNIYKDEVSRDVFKLKIEQFDTGVSSHCNTTTDQEIASSCKKIKSEHCNQRDTCTYEVPIDGCALKIEPYEYFEYVNHVSDEIPKVKIESLEENNYLLQSHNSHVSNEIEISVQDIKKEVLKCDKVAGIILRRTAFSERNFVCDACFSIHSSSQSLLQHKTDNICRKNHKSSIKTNLAKNRSSIKRTEVKPFRCELCDYKSARSHDLKLHTLSHGGEKPFKCDMCDYECIRAKSLKIHKMSHSGEKPFKCDICNYKGICAANLKTHKMSHSGEKPFKCDLCDRKYSSSTNLKTHKLFHSGEKPFQCDICSFKCSNASNLRTHKMSHSGEKPFNCDKCQYKSARSHDLKLHIMIHNDEKPFKCDLCDFRCIRSINLKKHKISHKKVHMLSHTTIL